MLKKRIKAIILASMLVFTLPIASNAMDKEDFLKFLVNTSYPESKNKDEANKSSQNKDENEKSKDEDYIKVHIGEENIPKTKDESQNENSSTSQTAAVASGYNNNIKLTSDKPRILLYHTHSYETYADNPDGNYHSSDMSSSVRRVGQSLTTELSNRGLGVLHTLKVHDEVYNTSYSSSNKTLNELLPKYPSVDITIDLHREGKDWSTESQRKELEEKYTATINGERVAKFFFVVGEKNPNAEQVNKLANDLTKIAQEKYPELILPVIKKPYGKFNQYMSKNGILVEIGSNSTTVEEAEAAAKYVADVIATYFNQN
ncbi:MAG: stage II sporulation protein P [Peptostreptococcaceae bacterium]